VRACQTPDEILKNEDPGRTAIRAAQPRRCGRLHGENEENGQAQAEPGAVGLLTVVATIIFVWGLFWLLGTPILRGGMDVTVVLRMAAASSAATASSCRACRSALVRDVRLRPEGGVWSQLRLDRELALPTDTRAVVRGDVFGAHTVDLIPGSAMLRVAPGTRSAAAPSPQLTQLATDLSGARRSPYSASADACSRPLPSATCTPRRPSARQAQELRAAFAELRLATASLRRTAESVEGSERRRPSTTPSRRGRADGRRPDGRGRSDGAVHRVLRVAPRQDRQRQRHLGRLVNDTTMYVELNHTLREVRALATDIRERPSRYFTVRVF
jgi:hypothetical protein